jgi:hypothetical protein
MGTQKKKAKLRIAELMGLDKKKLALPKLIPF